MAVASGDVLQARRCFLAAVKTDGSNARYRYNLALILHATNDRSSAAEQLTIALRLEPTFLRAAKKLALIFSEGVLSPTPRLDADGMRAALATPVVDGDLIAAAGLRALRDSQPLAGLIDQSRRDGWDVVARRMCLDRTHDKLKKPLFLEILRRGLVSDPVIELLLTAHRRLLLLEVPAKRFDDPELLSFAVALMRQCWANEFVWVESREEREALEACDIDIPAIRRAEPDAIRKLLLLCLYRRPRSLAAVGLVPADLAASNWPDFREALAARLEENRDIAERSARMPRLSDVTDATSRAVAGQYEVSPYPRWTSVPLFGDGYLDHIKRHFKSGQLEFTERPFEVLVAGCGTGRQAVSAAIDYGENARVTGIDITFASLGYASLMAERMGVENLDLAAGDINSALCFEPTFRQRFHIIECCGVLHHMADPFSAWRTLIDCLAPGGVMLIGLYSSVARRHLTTLSQEPEYPGQAASDDALRTYRRILLERGGAWPGAKYTRSRDFYTASGFRDFFLHVSETTTDLPEIARFLAASGLSFDGFVDMPIEALKSIDPDARHPGDLQRWADWEQRHPDAFSGMYQFWCTRA